MLIFIIEIYGGAYIQNSSVYISAKFLCNPHFFKPHFLANKQEAIFYFTFL
jgi:hypothetical protein